MNWKNIFLGKLILDSTFLLIPTLAIVLLLGERFNEILDMEGAGADHFPELCAIAFMSIFILLAGMSIIAKLTDRLKADAYAYAGKEYERDTTHYSVYIAIAGIFVLLSVLYSQWVDPYLLGESRVSVTLMVILPICIEYAVWKATAFAINRMEVRA